MILYPAGKAILKVKDNSACAAVVEAAVVGSETSPKKKLLAAVALDEPLLIQNLAHVAVVLAVVLSGLSLTKPMNAPDAPAVKHVPVVPVPS